MNYPANWDQLSYPFDVGCGGAEKPFIKNGNWYIRVINLKDHKLYIYDYTNNIFIPEDISLDKTN